VRLLVPTERVDRVVDHYPAACGRCGDALTAGPAATVGGPRRHQVTELPVVRAEVTEHRLHRVRCPGCGGETRADLPPDVPTGAFGPRLQATVAVLSGRYRLSRREVASVCADVLGAPVAVGSVDNLCQATAGALAAPVGEIAAAVEAAPVAHADETGWRRAGRRCWLWVAAAPTATLFAVAASRGSAVVKRMLGEGFAGHVVSDRWAAYGWVGDDRRQLCWAHLKRAFRGLAERPRTRRLGERAAALADELFALWGRARDDPDRRARLADDLRPLQAELRALLDRGLDHPVNEANDLCYDLLLHWTALWAFAATPGVEPTNNAAERALRPAVLWRKGSFGTQSDAGDRFVARILSVAATCKQLGRPLLAYLTDLCDAAQRGIPAPRLLSPAQAG
jgi:transposase